MSRRASGPSFSGLSKRLEEKKAQTPLKKMKSVRVVANNAVELAEVLKEQKVQREALSGLQDSFDTLREQQQETLRAVTQELGRLATLVQKSMAQQNPA